MYYEAGFFLAQSINNCKHNMEKLPLYSRSHKPAKAT